MDFSVLLLVCPFSKYLKKLFKLSSSPKEPSTSLKLVECVKAQASLRTLLTVGGCLAQLFPVCFSLLTDSDTGYSSEHRN